MYNVITVLKAIDLYNLYGSYNKVARYTKLYRQTITNWVKSFKSNLSYLKKRILQYNNNIITNFNLVNDDILKYIKKIIYNNPYLTKNK